MLRFSANIEASFLKTVVAVGPMPPVAANTNGEKQALSHVYHMPIASHAHVTGNIWTIGNGDRSTQKG